MVLWLRERCHGASTLGCLLHPPTTPCSGSTSSPSHYRNSFPASLPLLSSMLVRGTPQYLRCRLTSLLGSASSHLHPTWSLSPSTQTYTKECEEYLTRRTAYTGCQTLWVYSYLPLSLICPLTSSSGGRVWPLNCGSSGFLSCTIPPFADSLFPGLSLRHGSLGHLLSASLPSSSAVRAFPL